MEEVLQKTETAEVSKKSSSKSLKPKRKVLVALRKPLTTKKALELLLKGSLKRKVCRYCLNIAYPLSDLDQCLSIGGQGAVYNVTIRDVVASVHPFKVVDDPNFPNKICPKCINQALRAYLFAQQCEQAERALRNYFDDMYDKMEKLDPVEPTKKRGRQKNNPNHNVLYTEHVKVIDYAEPIINLINSGSVSHTNEPEMSELECKKCWQVLPNAESLVNHEKMHPKTMWYHCRLCGQAFAKLFHIRRHLKTKHSRKAQESPSSQTFMCNQCGFTSEDYNVHLQHIEKHKFKNVMEHLVERKMDDLCSVCLDKGALQGLEKTIRLHGAYPELTGNRSLYNILGSTIPEKEKHKYKELLVPSYANVLTITKKARNKHNQAEELKLNNFTISHPFLVSKESVGDKHMYQFIFSEPEILLSGNLLIIEEKNVDKVNESFEHENHEADNSKLSKMYGPTVNVSMEKKAVMTFKKQDVNEMDDNSKTCKMCWVFKKAGQCDVCKNKLLVNNIDPKTAKCFENEAESYAIDTDIIENSKTTYTDDNPKECNLCWVFKATEKCGFCMTSFKNTVENTFNVAENIDKIENKNPQKRKNNEAAKTIKTKKARWECSICFITNDDDRDACICCDTKALKDDSLKINFGSNTTFIKGIQETSKKLNVNFTSSAIDIKIKKPGNNFANNLNKNTMECNIDNFDIKSIIENDAPFPLDETATNADNESNKMQYSDDLDSTNEKLDENAMDFEDIDDVDKSFKLPSPHPLQVFSPTANIPNPNQNNALNFSTPTLTSFNPHPKTFQFNIGLSPQDMKPARKKRPLRGIATTVNK